MIVAGVGKNDFTQVDVQQFLGDLAAIIDVGAVGSNRIIQVTRHADVLSALAREHERRFVAAARNRLAIVIVSELTSQIGQSFYRFGARAGDNSATTCERATTVLKRVCNIGKIEIGMSR